MVPFVSVSPQLQLHVRPGRGSGVQPRGRGAHAHDEPAGPVGRAGLQGHAGRGDADVEERGLLRPLQGLLAQLAETGPLEHHRILTGAGPPAPWAEALKRLFGRMGSVWLAVLPNMGSNGTGLEADLKDFILAAMLS